MSKRKLLLADDSMTIQKVVNLTFADEGIEVFTVGNGSLAIEKLSEIEPDLVLADVHMPGLTGYEVCEQIRTNPRFQHVPVMLLVGSFEPFDEREAERVGANDYLTKPFQSIRQLIQKVTTLLDNQPGVETDLAETDLNETDLNETDLNKSEMIVADTDSSQEFQFSAPVAQSQNFQAGQSENVFAKPAQNAFDSPSQEFSFGDTALDDEMIETNSGNSFSDGLMNSTSPNQFELPDFGAIESNQTVSPYQQSSGESDLASENGVPDETLSSEMFSTEPLSYKDIQEMNSSMRAPTVQPEKQNDWEIFEFETNVVSEPISSVEPAQAFSSENFQSNAFEAKSNDEFALEFDAPISQPEPEEQLLETSDFEFTSHEEMLQTESRAEESVSFDFSNASAVSTANDNEPLELDLDEMNLLQIDEEDSILDLQTDQGMIVDLSTGLNVSVNQNEAASPVFAESQNSGGGNSNSLTQIAGQAVSNMNLDFPPHVIEAIAQLVIEKLSDKVIEKIAWEIVPDRFDLIVRQQMENRNR